MPNRSHFSKVLVAAAAAGSALIAGYVLFLRPWHHRWGATDEETGRPLPGDDMIRDAKVAATHAVTIDATPDAIWPWLIQMGQGRGGMYSYDWLDNLMHLQMHSANHILPQLQDLKVGDIIPLEPGGGGPPVRLLEPNRALLLGGKIDAESEGKFRVSDEVPGAFFAVTWLFFLDPIGEQRTRLIERFRIDWSPRNLKNAAFIYAFLEPGAFIMERGMLLGIKKRVEHAALRVRQIQEG